MSDRARAPLRRWAAAPIAPRRLDLRATVGPGAAAAIAVYRPLTRRGRLASWTSATMLERGVAFPSGPPIEHLQDLLTRIGLDPGAVGSMRSSHGDRLVLGAVVGGVLHAVIKIGSKNDEGLRRETDILSKLQGVNGPFEVPAIRWSGEWNDRFALATDAIDVGSSRPTTVHEMVEVTAAMTTGLPGVGSVTHGDLTPWNAVRSADRIVVMDWEDARFESDPLYDLAHFVIRQGLLVRNIEPRAAVALLTARGSPGWRYLETSGLDPERAPWFLHHYLLRAPFHARDRYRTSLWRELARRFPAPAD